MFGNSGGDMAGQMSVSASSAVPGVLEGVYSTVERPQYMNCCVCGVVSEINPSRMCINCIRSEVDITEGISRQVVLPFCRQCERFQKPPWVSCQLESRELLALCLKKIKGLNTVRLIDASFIWTEPHSRRLKVKCTIQKEVMNGAIIQQSMVVEFFMQGQQCDDCKRSFTPHTWNAVVQVRQRVEHKRTFLYLEQLILKHGAHEKVSNIVEKSDGLDFQFQQKNHAQRFVDFITHFFASKVRSSRQLISHDSHSNTHHNKFTFSVELCPICKDDVVFVPKTLCTSLLGGAPSILLCSKVTNRISLLDPFTGREVDLAKEKYWQYSGSNGSSFIPLLSRSSLVDFYVINVERIGGRGQSWGCTPPQGRNSRICMAEVEVCRESDLGRPDSSVVVTTHLGAYLNPGDWVSGYDFRTLNNFGVVEDISEFVQWKECNHDVILVKKVFRKGLSGPDSSSPVQRPWVLQRLQKEVAYDAGGSKSSFNRDLEQFKAELEEDSEMRRDVNLYWDPRIQEASREMYQKARRPRHLVKREKLSKALSAGQSECGDFAMDDGSQQDEDEFSHQVDISELLDGLSIDDLQ
ncbi:NMD3p-like protein [Cryptosporidium canis]|uniref:60S ribosomal export protein NMD3 n=1 Tax=Cryptosporidium canis TaxID=195482 RepID=A0ABQ8P5J8_9CRYT|nr:NMD3p-like protein [Cryptosporidium canis]